MTDRPLSSPFLDPAEDRRIPRAATLRIGAFVHHDGEEACLLRTFIHVRAPRNAGKLLIDSDATFDGPDAVTVYFLPRGGRDTKFRTFELKEVA